MISMETGFLPYKSSGLHFYIITFDSYVYIGESSRSLAKRWIEHIEESKGFKSKLIQKYDISEFKEPFYCYGFRCDEICEFCGEEDYKRALHAVEHSLHEHFILCQGRDGLNFTIVSDTEKTAPRRKRFEFQEKISKEIYLSFVNQIKGN